MLSSLSARDARHLVARYELMGGRSQFSSVSCQDRGFNRVYGLRSILFSIGLTRVYGRSGNCLGFLGEKLARI